MKTRFMRISWAIFCLIAALMVLWMVIETVGILTSSTSFPWWAGIVFPALYCFIPLMLSLGVWVIAVYTAHKHKGAGHEEK